jgi:hypothetical protein
MSQETATLIINGEEVGQVVPKGTSAGWAFGEFQPLPPFSKYAILFGSWAMFMHEDENVTLVADNIMEELRKAEQAIDSLRAELRWMKDQRVTPITQINIDGTMIEWRAE